MTSDLAAAYQRKKLVLWIEDDDTRAYLRAVWDDPDISYLIAGGNESVFGVVHEARLQGATHAFGFVDRDFRTSNRPKWNREASGITVHVPEALEIECYALDDETVAALPPDLNPKRRTAAEIAGEARRVAQGGSWWMAVRAFVSEVREAVTQGFARHPKRFASGGDRIPDLASAEAFVAQSMGSGPWITSVDAIRTVLSDPNEVRARLVAHEQRYSASLATEEWRLLFSGKEMFEAVASYVYLSHVPGGSRADLMLAIGEAQRRSDRVPFEITELRASLRRRANLEGWPPATPPPPAAPEAR